MIPNLPLSPDDVRDIAYRFGLVCMGSGDLPTVLNSSPSTTRPKQAGVQPRKNQ